MTIIVEKAIDSIRYRHTLEVVPINSFVHTFLPNPQGLLLDVQVPNGHDRAHPKQMGDFYEFVSIGLYGGERQNRHYVPRKAIRKVDVEERLFIGGLNVPTPVSHSCIGLVKPDIVDLSRKSVREIKANKTAKELKFDDEQIKRYLDYVSRHTGLVPTWEVYGHCHENIKSFDGDRKKLFEALASSTRYSVRFPLSLALAIWSLPSRKGGTNHASRYEQREADSDNEEVNPYQTCTRLNTTSLAKLIQDPEEFIRIIGKNHSEFTIKRFLSPLEFSIDGFRVPQFPILDIVENQLF